MALERKCQRNEITPAEAARMNKANSSSFRVVRRSTPKRNAITSRITNTECPPFAVYIA